MTGDVIDMKGKRGGAVPPPIATDFWFAQIDARLNQIEFVLGRLERQVWVIVLSVFAVLVIEGLRAVAAMI